MHSLMFTPVSKQSTMLGISAIGVSLVSLILINLDNGSASEEVTKVKKIISWSAVKKAVILKACFNSTRLTVISR